MSTTTSVVEVEEVQKEEVDWMVESAGSIYDRLTKKGARMGIHGNKMIRLLKDRKFLSPSTQNTIGKNKKQRSEQRSAFVLMPAAGVELLRSEMQKYTTRCDSADDLLQGLDEYDIPKSLRARAWHLADDPRAVSYLEVIFGGVNKKARRAHLDDKTQRNHTYWGDLCEEFFNNPEWQPQNPFSDSRVEDLKPENPPPEPYAPEELRSLFSKMRSQYSIFNDRYHRSGQLESGNGDGDDEFFDKFCGRDVVYFYAHLLFKACPPKFCTRDLSNSQKCDIGLTSPLPNTSSSGDDSSSSKEAKGNRV